VAHDPPKGKAHVSSAWETTTMGCGMVHGLPQYSGGRTNQSTQAVNQLPLADVLIVGNLHRQR